MNRRPCVNPWVPQDIARLEQLVDQGASAARAAAALGRTIIAVQRKARAIGRPFPDKRAVKKARLTREAELIPTGVARRS